MRSLTIFRASFRLIDFKCYVILLVKAAKKKASTTLEFSKTFGDNAVKEQNFKFLMYVWLSLPHVFCYYMKQHEV